MKLSYSTVREVLQTCGPLTMREVAVYFPDVPYQSVGSVLSAMRRKVAAKQIYIHSWTREGIGRTYLRAVYALGKKKDAPKPPLTFSAPRWSSQNAPSPTRLSLTCGMPAVGSTTTSLGRWSGI